MVVSPGPGEGTADEARCPVCSPGRTRAPSGYTDHCSPERLERALPSGLGRGPAR